jgi:hypothetical protein
MNLRTKHSHLDFVLGRGVKTGRSEQIRLEWSSESSNHGSVRRRSDDRAYPVWANGAGDQRQKKLAYNWPTLKRGRREKATNNT